MLKRASTKEAVSVLMVILTVVIAFFILLTDNQRLKNQVVQSQKIRPHTIVRVKVDTKEDNTAQEKKMLTKEIATLKEQLLQLNGLLNQAAQEKQALQAGLAQLNGLLNQAAQEKQALQAEKESLFSELSLLKEDLRLWEGKIDRLDERKIVAAKKHNSVRELTKRVKALRTKAQKEIDDVKLVLGNHGYMTKEGENTFASDRVVELERIVVSHSQKK